MLNLPIGKIRNVPGAVQKVSLLARPEPARYGYEDLTLAKDLAFVGQVENAGQGVFHVDGHYQTELLLQCGRCTESYTLPVSGDYSGQYVAEQDDQASKADEETELLGFSGDQINLAPALFAEIYLELPMQPLCKPDCRGLCPVCGVNLNTSSCSCSEDTIDPRWEKLKYLVESKKGV